MSWAYATCGWICVALGALGVVLPLLPTTPFLLLAASCFVKGSPRAHAWLLRNRLFGPLIRNWQEHRCVPPRAKAVAMVVLVLVLSSSGALAVSTLAPRLLLGVVGIGVLAFLWRLPTEPQSRPRALSEPSDSAGAKPSDTEPAEERSAEAGSPPHALV